MIPIAAPWIGDEEKQAVLAVLESGQLAQGAMTARLEAAFAAVCGVRHAVAVSSGTAALHLALLAHGIGPGDEVITASFSFVATANAALFVGARPVFVDIDSRTYTIDPALVEAAVTSRTRAIVPVHLYGQMADMEAINAIARRHGLTVIEDAAQAVGASAGGRPAGSFGTGCFSLYATKNVAAAEGGMITTDDDALAERLRLLRHHGQRTRYVSEILGYNYRMSDVHAAIGLAQLKRVDDLNGRRAVNAAEMDARLRGVVTPFVRPGYRHVYHQYTIRVPDSAAGSGPRPHGAGRDALAAALAERGIGTGIYYPVPIHRQPLYRDLGYAVSLPETERAAREVLSLPVHPGLSRDDLDHIIEAVNELCCA
jgi:perosamine synthetase